jgi:hypothetical protein
VIPPPTESTSRSPAIVGAGTNPRARVLRLRNRSTPVTSSAWREEQGTLARYLTDKEWNAVSNFYAEVQRTELALKECRRSYQSGEAAYALNGAYYALLRLGEPREFVRPSMPRRSLVRAPICHR